MAVFEVYIPGKDEASPNVTLTIEAQNWIGALKSGLKGIGEGQEAIANVMCDIKEDNSIHVTDVATKRVFRLREVPGGVVAAPVAAPIAKTIETPVERTASVGPRPVSIPEAPALRTPGADVDMGDSPKTLLQFQAPTIKDLPVETVPVSMPPAAPVAPVAQPSAPVAQPSAPVAQPSAPVAQPVAAKPAITAPMPAAQPPSSEQADTQKIALAKLETKKVPSQSSPTPRGVPAPAPKRPSGQFQNAPEPSNRESRPSAKTDPAIGRAEPQKSSVSVADAIAEVFDATQDLYLEAKISPQRVAEKMLDIALQHIPAESGTFYLADVNGHELTFTAVRGPKADALKKSGMKVKVGQGIIGFCAQEGVCLLVSDIQKDQRYFAQIAEAIGHKPMDTLCASAEKDGRLFGALQLINSKKGFDAAHMEVARYIGLTAAALLDRLDA